MRISLLFAAAFVLAACDATAPDAVTADAASSASETAATSADVARTLARVRRATAKYHRVERALADGYGAVAISPCVDDDFPVDLGVDLGGMGHHYINLDLRNDGGELNPSEPEILLYEPTKNGRFRLVGVEYVVPVAEEDWANPGPAPELFGQAFHLSRGAGGWALHVWTWKNNPSGMFADFNPTVSCDYAAAPGA